MAPSTENEHTQGTQEQMRRNESRFEKWKQVGSEEEVFSHSIFHLSFLFEKETVL